MLRTKAKKIFSEYVNINRFLHYVQGQEPEPKIREYFYYVDHQGMLFLDDSKMKNFTSCLKDKKFLQFFFKNLKINSTDRYKEHFPYISLCGRERNYVRCDDLPIVFTHIIKKPTVENDINYFLSYAHCDDLLTAEFLPTKLVMIPETGRIYHPAPQQAGSIGLIRSKLAIELSKYFTFQNGEYEPPTHFTWENKNYEIDQEWYKLLKK